MRARCTAPAPLKIEASSCPHSAGRSSASARAVNLAGRCVESHGGEVEIAIEGGVIVACTRSVLTFIRYDDGQVMNSVALVGAHPRQPIMVIDGGQIFVARNGEVACYTLAGDPVWVQPFGGMGFGSVALGFPGVLRQADDAGSK